MSLTGEQQCEIREIALRESIATLSDLASEVAGLRERLEKLEDPEDPEDPSWALGEAADFLSKEIKDICEMLRESR